MLEFSDLQVGAIVFTWLLNVMLGAFWYSPIAFEKHWSRLSGVNMMKMPKDAANRAIASVAVSALIQTICLAVLLRTIGADTSKNAFSVGLLVWAGFIAATTLGNTLYLRFSWKFWAINAGFFLVATPLSAVVLAALR
jgi:Protein of unknown function (DUF1761)